jgi:hypothetical protein
MPIPVVSHDTLYHYTSQSGLRGIIENQCIWATDVRYLNDSTEFSYAIKLASKLLKEKGIDDENDLSEVISLLTSSEPGPVFAASFSTASDQLSQWRGYCPDTGGFMLGFDISEIQRLAKNQGFQLEECIYCKNKQKAALNKVIDGTLQFIASNWSTTNARSGIDLDAVMKTGGKMRLAFALDLMHLAPTLKHPSFYEEREKRLIAIAEPLWQREVKFREGKSMIVPYIKFKLINKKNGESLPIKEIMVGPTPHTELSMLSVRQLLKNNKISSCAVIHSEIPYRPW